jgi:hypothetical protein
MTPTRRGRDRPRTRGERDHLSAVAEVDIAISHSNRRGSSPGSLNLHCRCCCIESQGANENR